MRRNIISFVSWLTPLLFLSISMVSKVNAEYVFNLPWNDVQDQTKDASVNISSGVSKLFKSFEMLENGKIADANARLKEAQESLDSARKIYQRIEVTIKKGTVDINKLSPYWRGVLERDFRIRKLCVPNSLKEAARLAREEIEGYAALLHDLEGYTADPQRNRKIIKNLVNNLHRFMLMGINISELAASNP